jgi:CBS domain containing-hemolysin-like protein
MAERSSPPGLGPQLLSGWLKRLLGGRNGESLRDTVEDLLDEFEESEHRLSPTERAMLINLLEFGELRVDDVMVPRADVVAVDVTAALDDVVDVMMREGHSRLPVYRDTLDDVLGMVHLRDLLPYWSTPAEERPTLESLCRQVLFVPPSMPVVDLLAKMRNARIHMSVVVDEYGGIDGLATIEDLVEPIVGEIWDEHDISDEPMLIERPGGVLEASARTPVEMLEERTGIDLLPEDRDEDVDTLGGLVFTLLGRIPARGELVAHDSGLEFEITDVDARRINRLRVRHVPPRPAPET